MNDFNHKINGFTLIEIMVVMVLIGVILTFATLSIGDGGLERKLEQEAQRLASLLTLASQESIMQSKEMGVFFDRQGYYFYVLGEQQWHALTDPDDIFRPRILPPEIQTEIRLEGEPIRLNEATTNAPQVLLLSSGEVTPFDILFTAETDETLRYRLTATALGKISVQREDEYY